MSISAQRTYNVGDGPCTITTFTANTKVLRVGALLTVGLTRRPPAPKQQPHTNQQITRLTLSLSPPFPFGLAAILLMNLPPSSRSKPNMAFCLQCVSNSEVGIIERLGKYTGLASPGLNCILWPIDVVSVMSSIRSRSKRSCTNLH